MQLPSSRPRSLALLGLLAALGCANEVGVSTTYDPLTTFPPEASYLWDASANVLPEDPRIQALDLGPLIEEVADEAFAERRYRRSTDGRANYRLSYQLEVHTWIGADNSRSLGSLSLVLSEAASGRHVWLGFARSEMHVARTREERKAGLREAFSRLLAGFPPGIER